MPFLPPKNRLFTLDRLNVINDIEKNHFWFRGRLQLVLWLLKHNISKQTNTLLDLGCGTGFNLMHWSSYASQTIGLDQFTTKANYNYQNNSAINTIEGCVYKLPFASQSIDTVISLDVLEHVPDQQTLTEIRRILKSKGKVIISVPAMPWLWSNRDEAAGHLRRYTQKSLTTLLKNNGFTISYINYYQFLLLPLVVISRIFLSNKNTNLAKEESPNKWLNYFLGFITKLEFQLIKYNIKLPCGSSLILVAEKS
jgi:ubiquinone/menaquinone biosynthesis C-methylase UbiE